ncbi:MAG: S-layer homology domain-containing protein, partial [Lysinibacillus sp.]
MKKILGLILATILIVCVLPAKHSFANDIANHQMKTELTYWANKGVILPDAKGNYNPDKLVTRGEFATYITRALNLPATNSTHTFKDINAGTTLAQNVSAAINAKIISGYSDGTFRPNDKITRQQMAVMLSRA